MLVTGPLASSHENVEKRLKHDRRHGVVNDFSLMSKLGGGAFYSSVWVGVEVTQETACRLVTKVIGI
jgi:hypothetical protein